MPQAVTSVAIDQDFLKAMMDTGLPLYQRRTTKPTFSVGDILAVRETYRWLPRGRIEFKVECDPDDFEDWEYANTMPIDLAKRFVKVISIEKMGKEQYKKLVSMERAYNKTAFGMPFVHIPYNRWFRTGLPVPHFDGEKWIVKYELMHGEIPKYQESNSECQIVNFYDYVLNRNRKNL